MKIDKDGNLWLRRRGAFRKQLCPRKTFLNCCDRCPHFGDPEKTWFVNGVGSNGTVSLDICDDTKLYCAAEDFIDERIPCED
jgi:hypothetical protein